MSLTNSFGEYIKYYNDGKFQNICNYVNGILEGEYKIYYDNGQLHILCNYVNGKRNGEYKQYSK